MSATQNHALAAILILTRNNAIGIGGVCLQCVDDAGAERWRRTVAPNGPAIDSVVTSGPSWANVVTMGPGAVAESTCPVVGE